MKPLSYEHSLEAGVAARTGTPDRDTDGHGGVWVCHNSDRHLPAARHQGAGHFVGCVPVFFYTWWRNTLRYIFAMCSADRPYYVRCSGSRTASNGFNMRCAGDLTALLKAPPVSGGVSARLSALEMGRLQ